MFKLLIASLATASALKVANTPSAQPLLKLRGGGITDLDTASLVGVAYFGGFGVTLLANPEMFYGANGILPYFKTPAGAVGTFFGRSFGAMMTGMAAIHFLNGPSADIAKAMAIACVCMLPQMYANSQDEVNMVTMLWKAQIVAHVGVAYIMAKASGLV